MPEDHRDRNPTSKTSIIAQLKSLAQKSRHHVQTSRKNASQPLNEFETFLIDKPTTISPTPKRPIPEAATDSKNSDTAATFIIDQPTHLTPKSQPPIQPIKNPDSKKVNRVDAAIAAQPPHSNSKLKPPLQDPPKPQNSRPNSVKALIAPSLPPNTSSVQPNFQKNNPHPLDHQDVTTIFRTGEPTKKPKPGWSQRLHSLVSHLIKGILRLILRNS
jgi:hypothetical protein